MSDTLLIELGTEELPPKTLKALSDAFAKECLQGLLDAQLIDSMAQGKSYAAPRRLAVCASKVLSAQADQSVERRGPALEAAFDQDGKPTPAALGFAKSCGVEVTELARIKTPKGEWLSYCVQQQGKTIEQLLADIIDQAIKRLPISKRMRWGAGSAEFVRPVKWLVVMYGKTVLPATVLGIESSNVTHGHRFQGASTITLQHADDYANALLEQGGVLADFQQRQSMIVEQLSQLAQSVGGQVEPDQALLDEVTGMVEYPTALLGNFDADFLVVPAQCLISSMRDHQKYFHLLDAKQQLLPHFITVSNIQSTAPARVQQGNERVLRARLSDAQFFWETDQKITLSERLDKLNGVLFHQRLGSVFDKTQRLVSLTAKIAELSAYTNTIDPAIAVRGAQLAKADLVSDMVGEFDELQGIMGHYYADRDGEPSLVGECIEQHYWPRFAGDLLPVSSEAQAVALADKCDSLVGIYAAGEVPTGDKDPYALRRAALSILRILIEQNRDINLSDLIAITAQVYQSQQGFTIDAQVQANIVNFIRGRLVAFYQNQDIATSTINAVMVCEPDSPLDFDQRVKAVHAFSQLSEASDLAAANKRISNLLKKQEKTQEKTAKVQSSVNTALFSESSESDLHAAIASIEQECLGLFSQGDYTSGLQKLAALRNPVDSFFENVMVMSDDLEQQQNRLALLQQMQQLFLRVANIALLEL